MTYATILMDPPWPEHGAGKCKRGADRHYPLIKCRDMFSTIRLAPCWQPADDAHLYMWVTNNYLVQGLQLMAALDFRYVTNICWVKDRAGLGQYFRGQHELCLFGVRGEGYEVRTAARNISSIYETRFAHSAKPPAFYNLVESRSKGPYLEMFARTERPGWDSWGNEMRSQEIRDCS